MYQLQYKLNHFIATQNNNGQYHNKRDDNQCGINQFLPIRPGDLFKLYTDLTKVGTQPLSGTLNITHF
jgi:hypothetical protein